MEDMCVFTWTWSCSYMNVGAPGPPEGQEHQSRTIRAKERGLVLHTHEDTKKHQNSPTPNDIQWHTHMTFKLPSCIFTGLICYDRPFSYAIFSLSFIYSFTHTVHVHKREMCIVRWAGFNGASLCGSRWPDSYTPEFRQSYWLISCLVVTPIGPTFASLYRGWQWHIWSTIKIHVIAYIVPADVKVRLKLGMVTHTHSLLL